MFYADAALTAGSRLALDPEHEERAVYVAEGTVRIDETRFAVGQLLVLRPNFSIVLETQDTARLLLLGGAPMDGPRHIWWNFVSISHERITQAGEDWKAGRFNTVPDETEFIPLPDQPPAPVHYP